MTPRACIDCDHRYNGVLTCPKCGGAGEPLPQGRGRGRPPLEDKRKPRGGFNDAEWAEVKRKADAAGMTGAAWVRMRCGV